MAILKIAAKGINPNLRVSAWLSRLERTNREKAYSSLSKVTNIKLLNWGNKIVVNVLDKDGRIKFRRVIVMSKPNKFVND